MQQRRISRRAAVRLGLGGGVDAVLAARAPRPATVQDRPAAGGPAAFVLVHGAWAGAWIWRKLVPVLREAGHAVYASTATGMGDRVHLADPALDLDLFVSDVANLLEYEDLQNVTLVGWSDDGMTISRVAAQPPEVWRLSQSWWRSPLAEREVPRPPTNLAPGHPWSRASVARISSSAAA
jgi:pimeloyl-ACP methyl ester carboxylesterase